MGALTMRCMIKRRVVPGAARGEEPLGEGEEALDADLGVDAALGLGDDATPGLGDEATPTPGGCAVEVATAPVPTPAGATV